MPLNEWKTNTDGSVSIQPVTGWEMAPAMHGMAGIVRIEFATEPTLTKRDAVQLVFTKPQVTELRQALERLEGNIQRMLDADRPTGSPS